MSFAILGLGTALPATSISQADAAVAAQRLCCRDDDQAALLTTLYRQTGIQTRHLIFNQEVVQDVLHGTAKSQSVFLPQRETGKQGPSTRQRMASYIQDAPPLALQAARQALAESRLTAGNITHLVTVSCTGFTAPGVDIRLVKELGLPATVERVHVGFMGCHGAINGMRVAQAFTDADPDARVLLCAVELCSVHFHYGWEPKQVVANALFADGAAALVGTAASTPSHAWRVSTTGSCLIPDSEAAMTWNIGDHGFVMTLSSRVPQLIATHLRPWLESWLAHQGVALEAVGSWAIHPGGPRIVSAVAQALGLDESATSVSSEVLAACGNMSSPTVLFILDRLRHGQAPRPCVALAFGPGLVAEAALIK